MFRVSAFVLLASFCLSGAFAAALAGRATSRCTDAVIKETHLAGHLNFTTYACPKGFGPSKLLDSPDAPKISASDTESIAAGGTSLEIESRQYGACSYTYPTCQSNVACNYNICNTAAVPTPYVGDCNVIGNYLRGVGGTFLVNPQTYVSVTYGTCEYVWGSRVGSGFLEYSYVNWGYIGPTLFNACIPPYRGAACISSSGAYFAEVVYNGYPF